MQYSRMETWTPERIRKFRKSLDLLQKDFASLLGVTPRYVVYLERGLKEPGGTLKRLLDCLNEKQMKKKKGANNGDRHL